MKVKDLIKKLEKVNPELNVLIDITSEKSEMLHLISINEIETIQVNEESVILVSPYLNFEDYNK